MSAPEPREITESFRIERVLKSSRSGIVFRALDPASGGPVAIKLIPPPPPAAMSACQARFVALAELLTLIRPPGIPAVHDFGLTPDQSAFLVMDLVDGVRLDSLEDLPPARVAGIALSVLETLAVLAGKGILHGNVSPDNILVGAGDRVWMTGLGTAALRAPGAVARVVLDGEAAEFAPPERFDADGGGTADWRGDLYSLALSVCSLLRAEVLPADAPAPTVNLPFDVAKGLRDPNVLRATLEQSLRRSPEERPPSYDIVRDALRRALGAAPSAVSPAVAPAAAPPTIPTTAPSTKPPAAAPTPPAPAPDTAAPGERAEESGITWDEPEGAPAWLQNSSPEFVLQKLEPRDPPPPVVEVRDEREDTNPVPLQRQAELGLRPQPDRAEVTPTVGAPEAVAPPRVSPAAPAPPPPAAPAPSPRVEPPPPPAIRPPAAPVEPAPPQEATSQPGPGELPAPTDMAQRIRFRIPPASLTAPPSRRPAPAAPPAPVGPPAPAAPQAAPPGAPAPPAAPHAEALASRGMDATPGTGAYELPAEPPAAPQTAPEGAAVEAPAGGEAPAEGGAAEPAAEAAETPAGEPAQAPAAPAPARRAGAGQPRWLVGTLAAAAVVLVGAVGVFVGLQVLKLRATAAPAPTVVPTRPHPTAAPSPSAPPAVLANLVAAEQAVAAANLDAAQAALDLITSADELSLGPVDLGRLTRVRAATNQLRLDGVLTDLRSGLSTGNLRVLRDAVRRVTREDEAALAADPDTAQTLDEARRAVTLLGLALKAQQTGGSVQLLQHASALIDLVPRSAQAVELREQAAAGIERDVDALLAHGRFDEAQERLAALARYWSARPGLAQRTEKLRAAQTADQRIAAILAQVDQAERERQPDRGLELLKTITPPLYYQERVRQTRARLEELLQAMDSNPPAVELPGGLKLEYSKNKPFVLTVRITDDHAVKSASVFVRVKGGDRYQEIPLTRTQGAEWRGEITPALHQNKTVDFYIVAADYSGHTGSAGTASDPLQLKKKWSLFGM